MEPQGRKRLMMQKALQDSEKKYHHLLENINDAAFLADVKTGKIIETNKKGEMLVGRTRSEILGMHQSKLHPLNKKNEYKKKFLTHTRRGHLSDYDGEVLRKDGKIVLVNISGSIIAIGDKKFILGIFRDITDCKRMEEYLRENVKKLNKIQEIARLGSWELDVLSNRLTWSDEVYRIFGLRPQKFGATYSAFLEAVHPEDRKAVDDAYLSSIRESKDNYEIEHRVIRKSTGEIRFVHEKCEHIKDASGKIIKSLGMVQDITDRKRAEEVINNLAKFPSENPSPVLRVNKTGILSYANSSSSRLLEFWGCRVGQNVPKSILKLVRDAMSSGNLIETEIATGDVIYSLVVAPIKNMDYTNLYGRDITKRKNIELAIQKSEEKYRQMVEHNIIGITISDMEKVLEANDAFLKIVGYTRKDLEQGKVNWLHMTPQAQLRFSKQGIAELLDKGVSVPFEKEYIRRDGSRVSVIIGGSLLQQKPFRLVSYVMDITERKKAEKKLQISESKYKALFEGSNDAIILYSFKLDKYVDCNKRAEELTGYSKSEIISKKLGSFPPKIKKKEL
ncbi:MAG: PAS domain S-box protein, partial [Patescibacteria group bacterium]|nr:PAS domain S-box protein [Patescibacteria group bacterium]